jgi:hypothetical protein
MSAFLPGRDLSRRFYEETVRPLLLEYLAGIPFAAAHLGAGSDVLGFDTEMSRDHDWGPTVHIFLRDLDAYLAQDIRQLLAHMHNSLGITQTMPESVSPFFNRPFKVIHGGDFAQALADQFTDPEVQHIASRRLIGSIDQFSDNTGLRCVTDWRPILRKLYE